MLTCAVLAGLLATSFAMSFASVAVWMFWISKMYCSYVGGR
jgi:hypothetical protein